MNINIYGVGRSGTKAFQLWLIKSFLQKFDVVDITYEPFSYNNRKLSPSIRGKAAHYSTPYFTEELVQTSSIFRKHVKDISSGKSQVQINKFIRANGRINTIDSLMKPDVSFLIVRDLYEVLNSICKTNWGLVENSKEWKKYYKEIINKYEILSELNCLSETFIMDKIKVTAAYWYASNMHALQNLNEHALAFDFEEITKVTRVISKIWGFEYEDLSLFPGSQIHTNSIIIDDTTDSNKKSNFNSLLVKAAPSPSIGLLLFGLSSKSKTTAVRSQNNAMNKVSKNKNKLRTKLQIEVNEVFDKLNKHVKTLLEEKNDENKTRTLLEACAKKTMLQDH